MNARREGGAAHAWPLPAAKSTLTPTLTLTLTQALLTSCRYRPPRTFALSSRRIDPAIICALRLTLLTPHDLEVRCDEIRADQSRPDRIK